MRRFFVLMLTSLLFSAVLKAQESDPFSPTVTRQEAAWISAAVAGENLEQALETLKQEAGEEPGPAVAFTLGNLYFQTEQLPEARAAYEQALKEFPNFRDAKINLGRVYLLLDQPAEAVKLYQELVRDGIADKETYMLLGHGLLLGGKPVSAETAFRQALLLDEEGLEARQGLLNTLLDQERYAEVLHLSTELLREQPGQKNFWAVKANAQLSLGESKAAALSLEQARRLGLADAEMLALLGQLYLQENIPDTAVARFEEAFARGELPVSRQVQAVGGLLQLGRLEEAETLLKLMEAQGEAASDVLLLRARLWVMQERYAEAAELLTQGLEQNPLDGEMLGLLAECRLEAGALAEAQLLLERRSRIRGQEFDALIQMTRIAVEQQRWADAVQLVERALVFESRPHLHKYLEQLRRMESNRGGLTQGR